MDNPVYARFAASAARRSRSSRSDGHSDGAAGDDSRDAGFAVAGSRRSNARSASWQVVPFLDGSPRRVGYAPDSIESCCGSWATACDGSPRQRPSGTTGRSCHRTRRRALNGRDRNRQLSGCPRTSTRRSSPSITASRARMDGQPRPRRRSQLTDAGFMRTSDQHPAICFLDITGYTRLTQERGDAAAAELADELARLVQRTSVKHGGRPIKWLGDGVMFYFENPADAVVSALEMIACHRCRPTAGPRGRAHRPGDLPAGRLLRPDSQPVLTDSRIRASRRGPRFARHRRGVGRLIAFSFTEIGPVELKGVSGAFGSTWLDPQLRAVKVPLDPGASSGRPPRSRDMLRHPARRSAARATTARRRDSVWPVVAEVTSPSSPDRSTITIVSISSPPAPRSAGSISSSDAPVVTTSSTSSTRSPGSISKPRRSSRAWYHRPRSPARRRCRARPADARPRRRGSRRR